MELYRIISLLFLGDEVQRGITCMISVRLTLQSPTQSFFIYSEVLQPTIVTNTFE